MTAKDELLSIFDEFVTEEDKKTSDLLMKLSNEIIRCRLDMGKSQKEFAEFLEYSQSMISKIESEQYNFTVEKLVNIFSKLGKEIDILIRPKKHINKNMRTKYDINDIIRSCFQEKFKQSSNYYVTNSYNNISKKEKNMVIYN